MATATALELQPRVKVGRPWRAAINWLAIVGPFFFLSYVFANWLTSQRAHVPSVAFGWEQSVPFIPWTIVPYWTSDFLYVASILVCATRREVDIHAKRLLAGQLISVACFLAFPLVCTFERPELHGFFGWLYRALLGFDKPFNQAPSLHVSLAVMLWNRFSKHLAGGWRTLMGAWLLLVVVSTMTTHQHQFLDLPTGALAGMLAIALFPDTTSQRTRLATFYLSGSVLFVATAFKLAGFGWLFLWPAAALLIVAIAYAGNWPRIFKFPLIRPIVAPYTLAAWINSRWWTRAEPAAQEIVPGIWLGRAPSRFDRQPATFRSIVNLAAELPVRGRSVPMLDLLEPTPKQLQEAVQAIDDSESERPTLICCALGYSRSAAAVAAWLVATGRARSQAEAIATIRERRPRIVLPEIDEVASAGRF